MNDYETPPNPIARIAAVGGIILVFFLVIVVIVTSATGSSDSGKGSGDTTVAKSARANDPDIKKALVKGEYTVKAGDTLTAISEATGIDIDALIQLNPDTDPQALISGRTIKLR